MTFLKWWVMRKDDTLTFPGSAQSTYCTSQESGALAAHGYASSLHEQPADAAREAASCMQAGPGTSAADAFSSASLRKTYLP